MKLGLGTILFAAIAAYPQNVDPAGEWRVTLRHYGQTEYARLKLESKDGRWTGKMFGNTITLSMNGPAIEIRCTDDKGKECGSLSGRFVEGVLSATGKLFDEEANWSAHRASPVERGSTRHEFVPKVFHNYFASRFEPVLKIRPGDTVHTTTVDAGGVDANGEHRSAGGNPLTGPFYIEGAWPGDMLVIKLNKVRLNRDTAGTYSDNIVLSALEPYYVRDQKRVENFDATWKLDRANGVATLTKPTDRMKNFRVKLAPMLGCIGVAPPGTEAFRSGRLGGYGGNLDYNQLREGTTVYLPVFHPGALLFVGDGHAAQGDGELTGNALETSMEVEFTVDIEHGSEVRQPRAENDEYVMVMGVANSLDDALRSATTGISRFLASKYKLNTAEIAMVLGSSMRYDIAEIVDPQVHVVAKLAKAVLKQLE